MTIIRIHFVEFRKGYFVREIYFLNIIIRFTPLLVKQNSVYLKERFDDYKNKIQI